IPADLLTPLAVYLKLSSHTTHSFLLESVEGGENLARYSFIGADPVEMIEGGRDAFAQLRGHLAENFVLADSELPAFIGGAIGSIAFDACELFEPTFAGDKPAGNLLSMMIYRSVIAFDHAQQKIKVITVAPEQEHDIA